MNRRGFLKRCGLIPFVGILSAVAQSETPESKVGELKVIDNGRIFTTRPKIELDKVPTLFELKCIKDQRAIDNNRIRSMFINPDIKWFTLGKTSEAWILKSEPPGWSVLPEKYIRT